MRGGGGGGAGGAKGGHRHIFHCPLPEASPVMTAFTGAASFSGFHESPVPLQLPLVVCPGCRLGPNSHWLPCCGRLGGGQECKGTFVLSHCESGLHFMFLVAPEPKEALGIICEACVVCVR